MAKTSRNRARSEHRDHRTALAEFGARHPIKLAKNPKLEAFYTALHARWGEILPHGTMWLENEETYVEPQFTVYKHPEKIGMTVLEKRLTRRHAQGARIMWERGDVARTKKDIKDEISKLDLSGRSLPARLSTVVRPGDPGKDGGRKIAVIVDQTTSTAELLVREHEIVLDGLDKPLRQFQYPYADYIPKLTLGRVNRGVGPEQLNECVEAAQALLPLTVKLEPISFFAHQEL